jgi:diguanylate cyclase (GGDEF)-like protein
MLSALVVAGGSTWLFSNAWVDLARAYGLLSIQERLANLSEKSQFEGSGEWAATLMLESQPEARKTKWLQTPVGVSDPESLSKIEHVLFQSISETNLRAGSFELSLTSAGEETPYFVVFQSSSRLGEENRVAVAGTQAQIGLREISPLAAPFLGFLVGALTLAALLSFGISHILNRSYVLLERALENIGAGRLEKLDLPTFTDPSVHRISLALQNMVNMLQTKENQIEKISALAHEDPMTKIPNFRAFSNFIDTIVADRNPNNTNKTLLAIIDLDFFKKVNDAHGHQVGDFVLRETAKIIQANIRFPNERSPNRKSDFCARYGGEEFVAIFNDIAPETFHTPVQRILRAIKSAELPIPKEICSDGKAFVMKISASIGVSLWDPKRFQDKDAWIKEADDALYAAKEGGRGRICAISPEKTQWT